MGPTRTQGTFPEPIKDSISTTASPEHSCAQPTLLRSKGSVATLSAGGHSLIQHSRTSHRQQYSSSKACSSAHPGWSQNQMPCAARASYSAPLPWLNARSKHAVCDLGVQLSCSFEESDDMHPGLATCCSNASLPACSTASQNHAHAARTCNTTYCHGDCGLYAHQHQQLASSRSSTAAGNRSGAVGLCPIAEGNSLLGSSQRSSSEPLSHNQDCSTAFLHDQGRHQLADKYLRLSGISSSCQQKQQLQEFLPCVGDPLLQIEDEIVHLLLMTQQLSAAASAATPGTPVAAACAAALRMHDATLMRALETRDALEQAAVAAVAAAQAEEEARGSLWHQHAAELGLNGSHPTTQAATAVTYGMVAKQHVDAWLATGGETAEDYMWQQQQQQQQLLCQQEQDLAGYLQQQWQQQQQACTSAPALMGSAAHSDATARRTVHRRAAAAAVVASHKQAEVDVQVLQLLPML